MFWTQGYLTLSSFYKVLVPLKIFINSAATQMNEIGVVLIFFLSSQVFAVIKKKLLFRVVFQYLRPNFIRIFF